MTATPLASGPLRVVSYGGGVQSTALLALATRARIPHRTFLFCNVGDDSEHPATLRCVREVATPFAAAHGIDLAWSFGARRACALPGCAHTRCNNCPRYALLWNRRLHARLALAGAVADGASRELRELPATDPAGAVDRDAEPA